jgi:hypothetical protein
LVSYKINKKNRKARNIVIITTDAYHAELMDKKINVEKQIWYKEHLAYLGFILLFIIIIYVFQ